MPNQFGNRRGGMSSVIPKRMVRSSESVDLATGCEGYYPLNNNLNDVSGKNRNMTGSGEAFTTGGLLNQALRQGSGSGSGFFISLPEFSVSAWIQFSGTAASESGYVYFDAGHGADIGIQAQRNAIGNVPRIYPYINGGVEGSVSSVSLSDWHHAVLTVNSTDRKLYIDGTLMVTLGGVSSYSATSMNIWATTRVRVDEVGFYSKVLDETERAILRNNGLGFNPFA